MTDTTPPANLETKSMMPGYIPAATADNHETVANPGYSNEPTGPGTAREGTAKTQAQPEVEETKTEDEGKAADKATPVKPGGSARGRGTSKT